MLSRRRCLRTGKRLSFDQSKILLDPYGKGVVVPANYDRRTGSEPGQNTAVAMKSAVIE
jgi:glycogen operon protein